MRVWSGQPPRDPVFSEIVGVAPKGLERKPATVRAFRADFSRARTIALKQKVIARYGITDPDDLLDSHTAWCRACLDGRARVDLRVGENVLPTSIGGEEVPQETWQQIFRALLKPPAERPRELRDDATTAHIDQDLRSGNVQVLLGPVPARYILTTLEVSRDGRRLNNELRSAERVTDKLKEAVIAAIKARH